MLPMAKGILALSFSQTHSFLSPCSQYMAFVSPVLSDKSSMVRQERHTIHILNVQQLQRGAVQLYMKPYHLQLSSSEFHPPWVGNNKGGSGDFQFVSLYTIFKPNWWPWPWQLGNMTNMRVDTSKILLIIFNKCNFTMKCCFNKLCSNLVHHLL